MLNWSDDDFYTFAVIVLIILVIMLAGVSINV